MSLRSLDLFSGIGGLTHAFRGIATPVMYCERAPSRCWILQALFGKGLLPEAPVSNDVQTLDGSELRGKVDIVVGGWPCVGFSSVGKRQGYENPQSALFIHLARLIDETRPPLVFQENVPLVVNEGLRSVVDAFDSAGYDCWWLVLPAYAVGAPQSRKRWFCLGVRRDVAEMTLAVKPCERHCWRTEPVQRMRMDKTPSVRLSALGNSVVPDCARLAFMMLFTGFFKTPEELWASSSLELRRPAATGCPLPAQGGARRIGSAIAGVWEAHRLPPGTVPPKPDHGLTLVPGAFVPQRPHRAPPGNVIQQPRPTRMWGTPRGGCVGASTVLTRRGKNDLYTALRFERDTPELRRGYANADWVDWLMGFPTGWTEFTRQRRVSRSSSS